MKTRRLRIILNFRWFDDIESGIKKWEYRLNNEYWSNRLVGRDYDEIVLVRGYTKAAKTIIRPYRGYTIVNNFTHEHFGPKPVHVFALPLTEETTHV